MRTNFYNAEIHFHFEEMRVAVLEKLRSHLPKNLFYHNIKHTLGVETVATELAKKEGMTTAEIQLIRTAALYHDSGFIFQHHENESHAVELAEKELPAFKYKSVEIQLVCEMIHSTQTHSDVQNIYDEILSDADHDYFGRADYFQIANDLRNELQFYGRSFNEEEWINFQLNYLEKQHTFLTNTAIEKRHSGKEKNIKTLKLQLKNLTK
jgi:predicted metal-dependent HD superfamily phosphohydrolase